MSGPIELSDPERRVLAAHMIKRASLSDLANVPPTVEPVIDLLRRAVQLLEGCGE